MNGLNSVRKHWVALKELKASKLEVIFIIEINFYKGGSLKFASKFLQIIFRLRTVVSLAVMARE